MKEERLKESIPITSCTQTCAKERAKLADFHQAMEELEEGLNDLPRSSTT